MPALLGGDKCPICGAICPTKTELDRHKAWKPLFTYRVGERLSIGQVRDRKLEGNGSHVVVYRISGLHGWFNNQQIVFLINAVANQR